MCSAELYRVSICYDHKRAVANLTIIDDPCGRVAQKDFMAESGSFVVSRTDIGVVEKPCTYGTLDGCWN